MIAVTQPGVRASDEDRQRVVAELERHTTSGLLSLDEFSDRVGQVYRATTRTELARITHDLPPAPVTEHHPHTEQRHLILALLLALATIAALGLALAAWK